VHGRTEWVAPSYADRNPRLRDVTVFEEGPRRMNTDLTWEPVTSSCSEPDTNYPEEITRAKVPGGWLVCAWVHQTPVMAFVPDQWFGWKINRNNGPRT